MMIITVVIIITNIAFYKQYKNGVFLRSKSKPCLVVSWVKFPTGKPSIIDLKNTEFPLMSRAASAVYDKNVVFSLTASIGLCLILFKSSMEMEKFTTFLSILLALPGN